MAQGNPHLITRFPAPDSIKGNARRVLFLVDRLELEDQANKAFIFLLKNDYKSVIYKESRDDWRKAEIVVTTIACADRTSADAKVAEILKQVRAIQTHMTSVLHQCLKAFLLESATPVEEREYEDPADQIREPLVHKNYFSLKDIEACMAFDVHTMSDEPQFAQIKILFNEFVALYAPEFST